MNPRWCRACRVDACQVWYTRVGYRRTGTLDPEWTAGLKNERNQLHCCAIAQLKRRGSLLDACRHRKVHPDICVLSPRVRPTTNTNRRARGRWRRWRLPSVSCDRRGGPSGRAVAGWRPAPAPAPMVRRSPSGAASHVLADTVPGGARPPRSVTRRAWPLPVLVTPPWVRVEPEEYSVGTNPK